MDINQIIVIRVFVEHTHPAFGDVTTEVLVWPDGIYTDLAGNVLDWNIQGLLKPVVRPFTMTRPLNEGVEVIVYDPRYAGFIWFADSEAGETSIPLFPSPTGENMEFYNESLNPELRVQNMPPRPDFLPVYQCHGQDPYEIFIHNGIMRVMLGDVSVAVSTNPFPTEGDTAHIVYDTRVHAGKITSYDMATGLTEVTLTVFGYTEALGELELINYKPGVWVTRDVSERWLIHHRHLQR